MQQKTWFNLTRILAYVFGITSVGFLLLTSNPDIWPGEGKHSLFFSLTLLFAGLTLVVIGVHVFVHKRERQAAATFLFFGTLTFFAGAFFLLFGLEA